MKNVFKKGLSVLLCVLMVFGTIPMSSSFVSADSTEVASQAEPKENRIIETISAFFDSLRINASAANTFESGAYTYEVTNETATITKAATSVSGSIVIPEKLDGYTVTKIGSNAFQNCTNLTSVEIPSSIKAIYPEAFYGCSSLNNVKFNDGLQVIGYNAFYGTVISAITLPSSVVSTSFHYYNNNEETIWNIRDTSAFNGANKLKKVVFAEGVTKICDYALRNCTHLTEVILPNTLTEIGRYAFDNCSALTNLVLSANMDRINERTFSNCTSLTSINIPGSIKAIYPGAFDGCTSLSSVTFNEGLQVIGSCAFRGTVITEVTIPKTVWMLSFRWFTNEDETEASYNSYSDGSAFYGANKLTKVIFADGIKKIGDYSLRNCTHLTEVVIPDTIETIGVYAFDGCTALTNLVLSDKMDRINEHTFSNCTSLTSIEIPSNIKAIYPGAFDGCTSLNSVTFNEGLQVIGSCAFRGTVITEVTIPKTVWMLSFRWFTNEDETEASYNSYGDGSAFYGASKLKKVIFADGIRYVGDYSLRNCTHLTDVVLPKTIEWIGSYAFDGCTALTNLVLSDKMDRIYNNTFSNCTSLTSINIPSSIKAIYPGAFDGCTSLSSVTFNEGLQVIGSCAFRGTVITEVTIPKTVWMLSFRWFTNEDETEASYNSYSDGSAFYGANKLTKVIFADGTKKINYYSLTNCTSVETIVVPDSVTTINDRAFYGCTGLEDLVTANGIDRISAGVYQNCTGLSEIVIPSNIKAIYPEAFYGCKMLGEVTLPEGLEVIGYNAFRETAIEEITIPKTVYSTSFSNYTDTDEAYINNTSTSAFYGALSLKKVIFANGVSMINSWALVNCSSVQEVVIPDSVTQICRSAFEGCRGLLEVTIPASVERVEYYAFQNCSSMKDLKILAEEPEIQERAFTGCSALENLEIPDAYIHSTSKGTSIRGSAFYNCGVPSKVKIGNQTADFSFDDLSITYNGHTYTLNEVPSGITWNDASDECLAQAGHLMTVSNRGEQLVAELLLMKSSATNYAWLYGTDEAKESKWVYPNGDAFTYKNWASGCPHNNYADEDYLGVYYWSSGSSWDDYRVTDTLRGYICEWDGTVGPDLSVRVLDETGADVTERVTIEWYKQGSRVSTGSVLKNCDAEKTYSYRIILDEGFGVKYIEPSGQAVQAAEDTQFTYTLTPISKITVSGKIKNAENKAVANADVLFTQTLNEKYSVTATGKTGSNGKFEIEVFNAPTTMEVSANEYYTLIITELETNFAGNKVTLDDIVLKALVSSRITFSLLQSAAVAAGENQTTSARKTADGLTFELFNATNNSAVKKFTVQYPYIILEDSTLRSGNEIRVSVTDSEQLVTANDTYFTLDANCCSTGEILLTENGRIRFESISGKTGIAIVFNESGDYVGTYDAIASKTTDPLTAGNYSVVLMQKTDMLRRVNSIDKLNAIGLTSGTDYVLKNVSVQNGGITVVKNVTIPGIDESRLYFTKPNETDFTASRYSLSEGKLLTLRANYAIKDSETTENQFVSISFPKTVSFIENSVTVDGVVSEYTYDTATRTLKVFTNKKNSTVRCSATPVDDGKIVLDAYLGFTSNGADILQPIGSVQLSVSPITFNAPSLTGKQKIKLAGSGIASSQVDVYIDGVKTASTISSKAGNWESEAKLSGAVNEYSEHEVYVVLTSTALGYSVTSDKVTVAYDPEYVNLSKITMINTAHDGRTREFITEIDYLNPTNEKLSYNYWPAYPTFTFTVEFTTDNPRLISDVYVVTANANDDLTFVPCTYDAATGLWVGTHDYKNSHEKPAGVSATFTYNEVEKKTLLLDELCVATDIVAGSLSLTRTYSSDQDTFSKTGLFGYGWITDYDLKAQFIDSDDSKYLYVSGNGIALIFEESDGQYECLNDKLIKATVNDDSIVIRLNDNSSITFDISGHLTRLYDGANAYINFEYSNGLLTKIYSSDGSYLELSYSNNLVKSIVSSDGYRADYIYSGGYLVAVSNGSKGNSYEYYTNTGNRSNGALKSVEYLNGSHLIYEYDSYGRITAVYGDKEVGKTTYEYTGASQVSSTNATGLKADYSFDSDGYLVSYSDTKGLAYSITYGDNYLVSKIDYSDGTVCSYEYDANGNLLSNSQKDAMGNSSVISSAEYDARGNTTKIIDGKGNAVRYTWNTNNLPESIVYPDGSSETFGYDADMHVTSTTDRKGTTVTYSYADGKVVEMNCAELDKIVYEYDAYGRVVKATQNGKSTQIQYNATGQITKITYPDGKSVSYTYNVSGELNSVTDSEGYVTQYSYDAYDRVSKVSDKSGNVLISYTYNNDSTVNEKHYGNGTYTKYSYSYGQVTGIYNYKADNSQLSFFEYEYDAFGNITKKKDKDGTWVYTYDSQSQLISVKEPDGTVINYTYDKAGNRVSETVSGTATTYSTNNLNEYTKVGGKDYSYDRNGNLISVKEGTNETVYEYDYQNRLVKIISADHTYEYTYDMFGNRNSVTVDGQKTEYVWSPIGLGNILTSYAPDGKASDYVYGSSVSSMVQNGQVYYYNSDILGSTAEITGATGSSVNTYAYDANGLITRQTGSLVNPFTYIGGLGVADDGSGLYLARSRYYSPEIGRFITPDSSRQYCSINMYCYANNNPVSMIDIDGEFAISAMIIGALVSVAVDMTYDYVTKGHLQSWQTYAVSGVIGGLTGGFASGASLGVKVGIKAGGGFLKSVLTPVVNGKSVDWWKAVDSGIFAGLTTFAVGKLIPDGVVKGFIGKLTESDKGVSQFLGYLLQSGYDWANGLAKKLVKYGIEKGVGALKDLLRKVFGIDDPSGYVYEAVPSNRLEGVTCTAYTLEEYYDDYGELQKDTVLWDASEFDQVNPLITNAFGQYAWDVPTGKWQVKYEKDGYTTTYSEWLDVPPPQTDVNISMVSTLAPAVESVVAFTDGIEIHFTQYMDISAINNSNIVVKVGSEVVSGTFRALNAEDNGEGTKYASVFEFVPTASLATNSRVTVYTENVRNYAGTKIESADSRNVRVSVRPRAIECSAEKDVDTASVFEVTIKVDSGSYAAGNTISVTSSSPTIVSVETPNVTVSDDGTATVKLKSNLPGYAEIYYDLNGTSVSATTTVTVNAVEYNEEDDKLDKIEIIGIPGETVVQGEQFALDVVFTPASVTNKDIVWTSSNPSVLSVDEFGIATALKAGSATITATSEYYNVKATYSVQVVAKEYTVSWIIDGKTTKQTYHEGDKLIAPSVPEKNGYRFTGWSPAVPEKMPAKDLSFTAIYAPNSTVSIVNYVTTKEIDYKATITFTVEVDNPIDGASVHWFVDGEDKGTGETFTVKQAQTSFTIQAKYIVNGNVLAESQQESVNVKTSFFAKLIAFFRSLFGSLPVVVQSIIKTTIAD